MMRSVSITRAAVASRAATVLACVVFDLLLPDHDAGVHAFELERGRWLGRALRPFTRWDAAHNLAIARDGYTAERDFAFFPLLPLLVRGLARALRAAPGGARLLREREALALAAVLVSNAAFVAAARALHRLTALATRDARLARRAALVFCATPAGVFFSAAYTESLFAALGFSALAQLHADRPWRAALLFALATACRANGVLGALFVLGQPRVLAAALAMLGARPRHLARRWLFADGGADGAGAPTPRAAAATLLRALAMCALVVAPSLAFQLHGYRTFCAAATRATRDAAPAWCRERVPSIYAHVQRTYWNVGFLRYYELKQLPNFALAAPALALAFAAVAEFARGAAGKGARARAPLLAHYAHLAVLAATGLLIAHVQVSTRLLAAASPAWYWHVASRLEDDAQRPRLLLYLGAFNGLGAALHSNFLPWT